MLHKYLVTKGYYSTYMCRWEHRESLCIYLTTRYPITSALIISYKSLFRDSCHFPKSFFFNSSLLQVYTSLIGPYYSLPCRNHPCLLRHLPSFFQWNPDLFMTVSQPPSCSPTLSCYGHKPYHDSSFSLYCLPPQQSGVSWDYPHSKKWFSV